MILEFNVPRPNEETSDDDEEEETPGDDMPNPAAQIALQPAAMLTYFTNLKNTTDFSNSPAKTEALDIIIDRIRHDSDGTTPFGDLFTNPKKEIRKEMRSFLSLRIPAAGRAGRCGEKTLEKWLSCNNINRTFMFIDKPTMRQIAVRNGGEDLATSMSADKMVERLVTLFPDGIAEPDGSEESDNGTNNAVRTMNDTVDATPIKKAILAAMLSRSFMKPLQGDKREHCRNGHKNELPIGRNMMNDINNKKLFPGFKVVSLHRVGLVAKKGHPYVKDSIDFIAFVLDESIAELELCGVEVKSRLSSTTVNKEKEFKRKSGRSGKDEYLRVSSNEAHKYIQNVSERYQILHHAYTYGFEKVVHVVANPCSKIISGTVVEFNNQILQSYGEVLKKLKNMTLSWAYDVENTNELVIPDHVLGLSKKIPTINGEETLYGALKLWRTMFADPSILPYPILQRILPSYHAQWNATKGGSDTVTKLVDDCFAKPPRFYTNFESIAFSRCISILAVAVLKLYHAITARENLDQSYPSIQHARNAASHRLTYKKLLRKLHRSFQDEITKSNDKENQGEEETVLVTQPEERARRRAKAKGLSTVPDHMSFAHARTFQTPKKQQVQRLEAGSMDGVITERSNSCTGYIVEVVQQKEGSGSDVRQNCAICKSKTPWQCVKCRLYFCMNYKKNKKRPERLYYIKERNGKDSQATTTKIYGKSCYHAFHEHAIRSELEQTCHVIEDSEE